MTEGMNQEEVLRFISGQQKKHADEFRIVLRYKTENNKIKKRHGKFVNLINDYTLVLYNEEKGAEGKYQIDRIVEIRKK